MLIKLTPRCTGVAAAWNVEKRGVKSFKIVVNFTIETLENTPIRLDRFFENCLSTADGNVERRPFLNECASHSQQKKIIIS
jgi:hypothetical protein